MEGLLEWYSSARRDLPWREGQDAYAVWVAETMSQQTRIHTVLPYYERFLRAYPRVEDLARAPLEDVLSLWSGLGYYRRAEGLWRAARVICARHGGHFPTDREAALQLPGVGPYTAGAVLSMAYGLPEAVLDGNVQRVLARLVGMESVNSTVRRAFWALLRELVSQPPVTLRIREFNQALMELGALVCTPRQPACRECPLAGFCQARRSGLQDQIPRAARKRPVEEHSFISAVIRDEEGLVLLTQTFSQPYLQGFWEFPKISAGVGDVPGTFRDDYGLRLRQLRKFGEIRHQVTYRRLLFTPILFELLEPVSKHPHWRWADPEKASLPFSSYILKIWRAVA